MTPTKKIDVSSIANTLPISECIGDVEQALNTSNTAILEAPPGAGKTSIVPLALLNATWLQEHECILMLQPRRVAARAAAQRMASLLNERVGETVGYHIRNEKKFSTTTRILVITEGILTRRLQSDPELSGVACIIFDEFHERNLDADIGLAYCLYSRELLRESDNPLKLLVMSATLEGLALSEYLNNPPLIKSEGSSFPVDIQFQKNNISESEYFSQLERTLKNTIVNTNGDILVFLPGTGEIRRLQAELETTCTSDIKIYPLHGSLNADQQSAALQGTPGIRKIILATDIAETSVTIDGISTVIDSGFSRGPVYDPKSGLTRLATRRISKASATQRAGRAGRTGPGQCIRLWSKSQHENLIAHYPAEILSADLCPLALQLLAWGVNDINELQWLNPPPSAAYERGKELLAALGAVTTIEHAHHAQITSMGKRMSELPVHPRLAHMLIVAEEQKQSLLACDIAALLSERDPLQNQHSDFSYRLDLIRNNEKCPTHLSRWKQRIQQQSKSLHRLCNSKADTRADYSKDTLAILLAAAFPDRIANQVNSEKAQYKIANGRMANLSLEDTNRSHDWLIAIELGGYEGRKEDRIFLACELNPRLFENALRSNISKTTRSDWDKATGRFLAEECEQVGAIVLSTHPINIDAETRMDTICALIRKEGLRLLNWDEATIQWRQRVLLARAHQGDSWPDVSEETLLATLEDWLRPFLLSVSKLDDLKLLNIASALGQLLSWDQQNTLNELLPTHFRVPSGSKVKIDYSQSPPVLSVKLQEMFGCNASPSVMNGELPLVVHLLSPARRPIQITQDLAGFWQNSYESVKRDMKGRYPKHPWPDDPTTAIATAATKKALARKR